MHKIKQIYTIIKRGGFRLFFNFNLFNLSLRFPNSIFSPFCIVKIKSGRIFKIGNHSSIGDFTKVCVDDEIDEKISKLVIGDYSYIGDYNNIRAAGGDIIIGNYCLISQHITMVASNHSIAKNKLIYKQPWDTNKTDIIVEDDVWIGAGCVILPGTIIHKGAIIAAGAVVTKNVPEYAIVAGIPAKVIKFRE